MNLVLDLVHQLGLAAGLQQRLQTVEGDAGPVDVGLEVPQVGPRPVLLLAGHLAGRDLVEQPLRAVGDLVGGEGHVPGPLVQRVGVGQQVVGVLGPLGLGHRRVSLGPLGPQVLLDPVPAGPLLTRLQVRLAGVHLRVEVTERLGHRLDPLPVHPGRCVQLAGPVEVTGGERRGELLRLGQQLVGLVPDVRGVEGVGLLDQRLLVLVRGQRLAGVADGELGPDAVADHAGLAGGEVRAGGGLQDQVAGQARADVLDLADDPQTVLGEQVELVHLAAGVRDAEPQVARRRGRRRHLARRVGRGHGQRARIGRGAAGRRCVVGAGGQQRQTERQGRGRRERTGTGAAREGRGHRWVPDAGTAAVAGLAG